MRSAELAKVADRLQRRWRQLTKLLVLRSGPWRFSRSAEKGDPLQGWKIHLAATVLSAGDVFALAYPILRRQRVLFKVPAELSFLAHLNSGSAGFSQIGKFLTIYPKSTEQAKALLKELHRVTRGRPAPEIPFDIRYRCDSSVFYRYGAFASLSDGAPAPIFDPRGEPHTDQRAPRCAIPPWLNDPFAKGRRKALKRGPIGLDYLVSKAYAQRGKGGVFEALDLSVFPARLVIIKQGRTAGEAEWNGEDGFARVKREGQTLRVLRNSGIPVPEVIHEFDQGGHHYLVVEKAAGRSLNFRRGPQRAEPSWQPALRVLEEVGTLLSRMHESGWVWRDCKPSHIFRHRGRLTLIDFEGACRVDQIDLLPWGSPDYTPPKYHGASSRRRGTWEDDYALGVMAFQFLAGEFPSATSRARSASYQRAGCPDFLRIRIESLLRF